MKPASIRRGVGDLLHMTLAQGETISELVLENRCRNLLELGFRHGVSTCYLAAALHEQREGHLTTIDRTQARDLEPNVDQLLARFGLESFVTVYYEPKSYLWRLMKMLEEVPGERFDFLYLDGAHDWYTDGFAFLLVDRLLEPGGLVVFDDLDWTFEKSPSLSRSDLVREMPAAEKTTPQVRKVYELLVKTHPAYGDFEEREGWALARKTSDSSGVAPPEARRETVYLPQRVGAAGPRFAKPALAGNSSELRPLLVANYDFVMGGGEVGLRMLVEALVERGHRPTVAVPGSTPLFGICEERSIPSAVPAGAVALSELAADCDLIHVFSARSGLKALLANTSKPLVVHALMPDSHSYDPIVESFASLVLCNSRATAARFGARARVLYNGVPRPGPSEVRLELRPDRRTIAIIGNLCPRKGQLDALPALEEVLTSRPDVDVVFIGRVGGPVGLAVKERAEVWGERMRLLGFVPRVGDLMSELTLVLVPSRSEGFGRVAVESLRAGVPVLATRVEGLVEALAGLNDPWLPAEPQEWAERILRELDRPVHSRAEMMAAGERFDPDRFSEEILDYYRQVLAGTIDSSCPYS